MALDDLTQYNNVCVYIMYKLVNCKKAIFGDVKESKTTYSILINDNIIEDLGETGSFEAPASAEVINLPEHYVLTGLIDAHMHFFGVPSHQHHLLVL